MTKFEAIFFWISIWFYGFTFVAYLYALVFKKDKWLSYGWFLIIAGFVFQTTSMGIRWVETGHPPVMGTFENSMLGSWFILIVFMIMRSWYRRIEIVGVLIIVAVILMMGNGVMGNPILKPLSPPYKSNWLWLHVFFAWIAYGAFCMGAGLGIIYLLKGKIKKSRKLTDALERLPKLEVINELILKVMIFGFVALSVEISAGALWAYDLWGRYWGWDPIETWSLITWLTYGICIHLGVTLGWKGKRMAWLAIFAIFFVFITFGGIGFFGGVHTLIL